MSAMNRAAINDGAATLIAEMDVSSLSRAECAALLGKLIERLLTSDESKTSAAHETRQADADKLLTVEQVATTLGVPRTWVYRNGRKLGLAVELGKGTIRYSQTAIQAIIQKQRHRSRTRGAAKRQHGVFDSNAVTYYYMAVEVNFE